MAVLPLVLYDMSGSVSVIVKQYRVVDEYTVFIWLDVLDRAVLWQGGRDRATGNIVGVTEHARLGRGDHRLLVRSSLGWSVYPYLVVCSGRCVVINTREPPVYRIPWIRGAVTLSLSSGYLRACSGIKAYNIPSGMSLDARWSVNAYDCNTYGYLGGKTMNTLGGCVEIGVGDRDCAETRIYGAISMAHGIQTLWETSVRVDRRVYRGVPVSINVDHKWYEPLERLVGEELVLKPVVPVSREALQPHVAPVTGRQEERVAEKQAGLSPYKALLPLIVLGGAVYVLGRKGKK